MSDFNDPAGFDLDAGPFDTGSPDHGMPVLDSSPDPIGVDIPHDESVGLLHGSPDAVADDWFEQSAQGYCLPASVTQILSEVTGHHFSDESVVMDAVEELGIDFSSDGMPFAEGVALLEHFGVDAELESGLTPSDLQTYLDEGRSIVLGVDAFNIWDSADNPVENPEDVANHALLITGIDPERGFVVLSDPGNPDGNQDVVPMEDFLAAWSDSDYSAIVTTEPTLRSKDMGEPETPTTLEPGPVLLPITLNGDHPDSGADADGYTVQAGDTLWDIAERVYGDGSQFQKIADASGIANPDLIYPGQVVTIPK